MDPSYRSQKLSSCQINMAMEFLREVHESCLLTVFEFRIQAKPYKQYMCLEYWKYLSTYLVEVSNPTTQDIHHLAYLMLVSKLYS